MKKIASMALALLMLFLVGCGNVDETVETTGTADTTEGVQPSPGPHYTLVNEAGENYMVFSDEYLSNLTSEDMQGSILGYLTFDSVEEFKTAVTEGKMTQKDQEFVAKNFIQDETGRIKTCDFNDLQIPIVPSDIELVGGVDWQINGEEYSFNVRSLDEKIGGYVMLMPPERYQYSINDFYESSIYNPAVKIEKSDVLNSWDEWERHSKTIYTSTKNAKTKYIIYKFEYKGMNFHVVEHYTLWASPEIAPLMPEASDSVPVTVTINGKKDDHGFKISLHGFTERPSMEFIKSFGIQKFEG